MIPTSKIDKASERGTIRPARLLVAVGVIAWFGAWQALYLIGSDIPLGLADWVRILRDRFYEIYNRRPTAEQ